MKNCISGCIQICLLNEDVYHAVFFMKMMYKMYEYDIIIILLVNYFLTTSCERVRLDGDL